MDESPIQYSEILVEQSEYKVANEATQTSREILRRFPPVGLPKTIQDIS